MTEEYTQDTQITLGMTRREAYEFLANLADDDFRRELESDPAAVLKRYRISVSSPEEEDILAKEVTLPPKDVCAALLEQVSEPDSEGLVSAKPDAYGYALFAVVWRVAFAMPMMPPVRGREADGAG